MKIGDKVRFLSEVGGGVVVGFTNNNIALVEDEDGFQIPIQKSDIVVVNEDKQIKSLPGIKTDIEDSILPSTNVTPHHFTKEINYKSNTTSIVDEREEGNKLNLFIAFVPCDIRNFNKTKFHVYIINDCNYFISYTYSLSDGKLWNLLSFNELEPNTKLLISEVEIKDVEKFKNGALQLIAYKRGKPFVMQPTMEAHMKVDPVKFYKLHSFKENDFFDENALVVPAILDGKPVKELEIDTDVLEEKMMLSGKIEISSPARKKHLLAIDKNAPLAIDLHATELLETTVGLSNADILNYQIEVFRKTLEEFKIHKGMKIVFIHGKGEGVLRNALIKELRYRYKQFSYQDASFQEYGYGATQVTIH